MQQLESGGAWAGVMRGVRVDDGGGRGAEGGRWRERGAAWAGVGRNVGVVMCECRGCAAAKRRMRLCTAARRPQVHASEGVGERGAADPPVCGAVSGDARSASAGDGAQAMRGHIL